MYDVRKMKVGRWKTRAKDRALPWPLTPMGKVNKKNYVLVFTHEI